MGPGFWVSSRGGEKFNYSGLQHATHRVGLLWLGRAGISERPDESSGFHLKLNTQFMSFYSTLVAERINPEAANLWLEALTFPVLIPKPPNF